MSNRINSDCASPENSTDNNSNVEKMIGKMKFNMASNILMHAQNNGWESHEIANLITLLACELHLKGKKLLKFLMKVSLCNSEIISCLGDHGLIIKPIKILKTIIKKYSFSDFMHTLKSGLDQELFDTKDDRIIKYVSIRTRTKWFSNALVSFAYMLKTILIQNRHITYCTHYVAILQV